ncbi:MAG: inositol monophosphatase [Nitrospinae bacterium]|nr:inositol monophosphatase [Nitrospinota bacterium]
MYAKERAVAEKAARVAGAIMREFTAKGFEVRHKGAIDLVTEADVACEKAIVAIIRESFPDHAVVGEEGGASGDSPFKWIIDPIDGTTNFAHGFPVYCASVGFEANGELAVGAVYDPTRDELFAATVGKGAMLNGAPIKVSEVGELEQALLATGFPYAIRTTNVTNIPQFERFAMRAQAIRRPGAAALDLCYVACGRLDGFWEYHLHPWDMAAGALLVKEAGGVVTDANGGAFNVWGREIVASNGALHEAMVGVLGIK